MFRDIIPTTADTLLERRTSTLSKLLISRCKTASFHSTASCGRCLGASSRRQSRTESLNEHEVQGGASGLRICTYIISHQVRVVILVLHLFIPSPSYRLFKDSEFGIMAEIVAGPFDCVVLQKMREMHQNAVCQSDHDDELRAVAVPSPFFKGDPIDFAQDAVPVWENENTHFEQKRTHQSVIDKCRINPFIPQSSLT